MKLSKGTPSRPRLSIFRSNRHFYAQVIDDNTSRTLFSCSTLDPIIRVTVQDGSNKEAAKQIGQQLGKILVSNNLKKVQFDRRFLPYHGRVAAFAEGAREMGLEF